MPARTQTFAAAAQDERNAYVAALANLIHAAGATTAISQDAAEAAADIAQAWHDGRHDDLQDLVDRACRKLREIRRRVRQTMRTVPEEARPRPAAATTPCLPGLEAAKGDPEGHGIAAEFQLYRVSLRAASISHVGANSPADAIKIAAAHLPNKVTYARVEVQKEKF